MRIYNLNITTSQNELNIGFDEHIQIGGSLQQFKNFEYVPVKKYDTINGPINLHVLKFKNLDNDKKELIFYILKNYVEHLDEDKITILDIIESFSEYFSKKDEDFLLDKLIGDLGEIVFILKLQDLDIDYSKYYQLDDNSLYDFNFNGHYVDVKTTSQARKLIYLTKRQAEAAEKISFLVCEINKLHGKLNIIDLLNLIEKKNKIIKEKIDYWNNKYKTNSSVIDSWTIDLTNVVTYFVDDKTIPSISVLKNGGLIDIQLKVSVASSKKKPISEIKKLI